MEGNSSSSHTNPTFSPSPEGMAPGAGISVGVSSSKGQPRGHYARVAAVEKAEARRKKGLAADFEWVCKRCERPRSPNTPHGLYCCRVCPTHQGHDLKCEARVHGWGTDTDSILQTALSQPIGRSQIVDSTTISALCSHLGCTRLARYDLGHTTCCGGCGGDEAHTATCKRGQRLIKRGFDAYYTLRGVARAHPCLMGCGRAANTTHGANPRGFSTCCRGCAEGTSTHTEECTSRLHAATHPTGNVILRPCAAIGCRRPANRKQGFTTCCKECATGTGEHSEKCDVTSKGAKGVKGLVEVGKEGGLYPAPPCKHGVGCYRADEKHLTAYRHPPCVLCGGTTHTTRRHKCHTCGRRGHRAQFGCHTVIMYHGTPSHDTARAIFQEGFRPSSGGMFGPGVYVTEDRSKAKAFGDVLIEVLVMPGRVHVVRAAGDNWQTHSDTAHAPPGTSVRRSEHCVKDPRRVVALRIVDDGEEEG